MKNILFIMLIVSLFSCDWAKRKTKETVNKSGEIVAKTGSEFVDGISKGIEKTFQNESIINYINDNYYAVKFDAEQKDEIEFNGKMYKLVKSGRNGYHGRRSAAWWQKHTVEDQC